MGLAIAAWLGTTALVRPALAAPSDGAPPAAPTRVVVRAEGCEGLSQAEVGRLLDIELAMVTTEIRSGPPLQVELGCEGERLTIAVIDPLTRKRLQRDVPAPAPEPGRERVVALAISQLFAASWLELLSATEPPPPPPDDPTPPPDDAAVEAARRVAERSTERRVEPAPRRRAPELLVGLGVRGRALEGPGRLAAARTELVLRGWPDPRAGWVAVLGLDAGGAARRQGQVRGQAFTLGAGLGWSARGRRVDVGGHVVLAGGVARIRGVPRQPGATAAGSTGLTAEASAGIGPRVRYGRLRLDLDAELGGMLRSPVGTVSGGSEPPMTMGGLWAGVVLRLGGSLRSRGATGRGAAGPS